MILRASITVAALAALLGFSASKAVLQFASPGASPANSSAPLVLRALDALPLSAATSENLPFLASKVPNDFDGTRVGLAHALRLQYAIDRVNKGKMSEETLRLIDRLLTQAPNESLTTSHNDQTLRRVQHAGLFGEWHRGQVVCALAESGVPATWKFRIGEKQYHVDDLVQECQEFFELEDEFEWQVIALALYYPQLRSWSNAKGEEISWTKATDALLRRVHSYGETTQSCTGLHTLFALAVLYRVNELVPIWDGSELLKVQSAFKEVSASLRITQFPDGSWDRTWKFGSPGVGDPRSSTIDRLLITGHQLEWLALVPRECRPGEEVVQLAGDFVAHTLSNMTSDEMRNFPCACSHGLRALYLTSIITLPEDHLNLPKE